MPQREREQPSGIYDQMRYARATHRIAKAITTGFDAGTIREAMVQIIGETLDVDRTLIYEIRFDEQVAEGLCEWLNPATEGLEPTIATYPLAVFGTAARLMHERRSRLESYTSEVHPAIAADSADVILHQQMCIESLLWFPFDFEELRYQALVFNQVRHERRWSPDDLAFVESVAELVSTAHLRIRLEAERREVARKEQQRARLAGLGLLARGVAHDFNNLLTAILGNATALRTRVSADGDESLMVESITEAARSAAAMCRQLLTYAGDDSSALERLDLNVLVESTLSALSSSLAVPVAAQLSPAPVWVMGDSTELSQVLLNLVTNASQASAPSGAAVLVRTGPRAPDAAGPAPFLEVIDEGHGMDAATQARMFDAFFTTKSGGHGLGLASVHTALARHDAAIDVDSAPRQGTRVRLVFPPPDTESGTARQSALLLDADRTVQQLCASALALEGYRVASATTVEEALACCEARTDFDLVVMDLELASADDWCLLGALRDAGVVAPMVLLGDPVLGAPLQQDGPRVAAFLPKPFAAARLLEVTAQVLAQPAP